MAASADVTTRPVKGRGLVVTVDSLKAGGVLIVLAALAALLAVQAASLATSTSKVDDGRGAVSAARAEVLALVKVNAKSTDADIARIADGATSDFKSQFTSQATAFREAIRTNKVESTGSVVSAGLVSLKGDKATVLVASSGTVKNAKSKGAEARSYRLKVAVERVGDRWLVAGIEFVS